MAEKKRNYAAENAWQNTPKQVKRRMARNRARYAAVKKHGKAALVGKEVDHIKMNPRATVLDNSEKNIRIISKHANRVKQPKRKG